MIFVMVCFLVGGVLLQADLTQATEDEVKIGAAISLTGKLTREGTGLKKGYDFWADWVNERGGIQIGDKKYKAKMIYYDDESNPQRSAKLVEKLITEDKVDMILGPYGSGIAMASSTIAERYGYVMILALNNSDKLYSRGYKNIFSVLPVASRDMVSMVNLAMKQTPKPKTISIITSNSPYPLLCAQGLNDYAKEVGLEVLTYEKFPEETSDLSSLLSVIKSKDPDLLYETGYFEHSVLISRQLKDLGWVPKALAFSVGPQLPDFVRDLGKDAEGTMGVSYWHRKMMYKDSAFTVAEYNEMFKEKFGEYPNYLNAFGTAGGRLLQQALEKAGSLNQDKIRGALRDIEIPDSIIGGIKYDEAGRNLWASTGVLQIQNGKDEIVYPEKAATASFKYPVTPWGER
jgi:branched-chain amino acid transport system substrate-binding protein